MPPANAGKRYPAETLSADEIRTLIGSASGNSSTAIRNRGMLAVTYQAALRIGEALQLRPCDVDLASGVVRIINGKGAKPRTVAVNDGTIELVRVWRERRRRLGLDDRGPLFSTLKGGRLDSSYARRLLPKLAARAGIRKRCHPHLLRHSRAKELVESGTPISVIRDILGHGSISSTDAYLRDVAPQQVIAALRASDWKL